MKQYSRTFILWLVIVFPTIYVWLFHDNFPKHMPVKGGGAIDWTDLLFASFFPILTSIVLSIFFCFGKEVIRTYNRSFTYNMMIIYPAIMSVLIFLVILVYILK